MRVERFEFIALLDQASLLTIVALLSTDLFFVSDELRSRALFALLGSHLSLQLFSFHFHLHALFCEILFEPALVLHVLLNVAVDLSALERGSVVACLTLAMQEVCHLQYFSHGWLEVASCGTELSC